MRPLDLTPRGVLGTLAVLVVAGVCIRLGVWQLDRRAERLEHNRAIAERLDAEPLRLETMPTDTVLAYRRARLTGAADDARAIVLAGRSRNGAPGVHVLSPVRLAGGAVLVNRGWLPARDGATVDVDAVRLEGDVQVEGVLVPFPDVDLDSDPEAFQVQWFRVDGDAIRAQYPYPVAPVYLVATAAPEPAASGDTSTSNATPRPVPVGPPTVESGPHLSYAIQWFSFAAIFLIGWLVLLLRRESPDSG